MYSMTQRAAAIFTFAATVLAVLTFLCFVSVLNKEKSVQVQLDVRDVAIQRGYDPSISTGRCDRAYVSFAIKADFTPLFNWNTKELFIYLTAEYKTDRNQLNQIVLWDYIMTRNKSPKLSISDNPEYVFTDDGHGLKGHQNVTLRLSWNIIPIAGLLPRIDSGYRSFKMPNEYLKRRSY